MTVVLGILTFLLILGALVLVHETGHYSFAKLFGVRVDEFGVGFPPRVKSWERGGTLYSLNAIPLGGFVKMAGENGEDHEPGSFGAKAPWKRFIILIAGASMNIMLAFAIFFGLYMHGAPRETTMITRVVAGTPAASAHLRVHDQIVAVDGRKVRFFDDLATRTATRLGHRVDITILRGQKQFSTSVLLRMQPPKGQGPMGIVLGQTRMVSYGLSESARLAGQQIVSTVTAVPQIVTQRLAQQGSRGNGNLVGPVGIAHITTSVVQHKDNQRLESLLGLMALLSANLGVLNLLPFPALDGGRIVFVLISGIRRRNLDPEVEGMIHAVGMAVLLTLVVVVSYHDIARWISGASV